MNIILETIQNQSWFNIATAVVALASTVAAATPTPKAGTTRAKAYKIIDFLALNIFKAKQK